MKHRLHLLPALQSLPLTIRIIFLAASLTFIACNGKDIKPPVNPDPPVTDTIIPTVQLSSANLISGQLITVTYNPKGRPLANANAIYIYVGYNDWSMNNTGAMKPNNVNGTWSITYMVPQAAYNIAIDFNDGAASNMVWDNNGGANWNYTVTPGTAPAVGAAPALPANASKAGVMMQGFYWDCPPGWYNTMASKAAELRNMIDGQGIDRIWFPPPSKGFSAASSMGYDPYDYYDLGQYTQFGTTATHFGTQAELKAAVQAFKTQGIVTMADIVLNHRSGGAGETNPNAGNTNSWTDYSKVASGKCTWRYDEFHPSSAEIMDEGVFGGMADVCYETGNTAGHPHYDMIEWGNWLKDAANAGFDGGWRFDFVKGYHPSMVADFRAGTGNAFGIIECWDKMKVIESFVKFTGNSYAFDFPGYGTLKDVFNSGANIADLVNPEKVFAAKDPGHAVTFVANHDIDELSNNRMLAYAFILTYKGYPCIFWKDYFDRGLADLGGQTGNGIKALVWARGALAGGHPDIENLKTDNSTLLAYGTVNGSTSAPGYIIAINNSGSAQTVTLTTSNTMLQGKTLECKAWYSYINNIKPANIECASGGEVSMQVPANGYVLYSVK